ncbi:MAG: response regulator [Desulfobacterales bacterium]|nr:response regulator [Desulfobacterales bacterium]
MDMGMGNGTTRFTPLSKTLIKRLFVFLAALAVTVTLVNYKYLIRKSEAQYQEQLREYIIQRGKRESELFSLARDNLLNMRREFLLRLSSDPGEASGLGHGHPKACLDQCVLHSGLSRASRISPETRHTLKVAHDLILEYGPPWRSRFENLWFMGRDQLTMTYWPAMEWSPGRAMSVTNTQENWFNKTNQDSNPGREIVWTGLYFDARAGKWMITAALPVDLGPNHVGTLGTDLECRDFFYRNLSDSAVSSYSFILGREGQIIVHPYKIAQCISSRNPSYTVALAKDPHLTAAHEKLKDIAAFPAVIDMPEFDELLAVTPIEGPGWYLFSVCYKSMFADQVAENMWFTLAMGTAFLMVSLLAVALLVRRHISLPLGVLTRAAERFNTPLGTPGMEADLNYLRPYGNRRDEVGLLMRTFIRMAHRLNRLYEAQEDARQHLEETVRHRTRDLEKAKGIAEAANQDKTRFLANMSHELRTPLNVILGFSQLMERQGKLTPEQRENLGYIQHSGAQLLDLINDVLDMSKIESGKTVFYGERFDLTLFLENIAAMFRPRAGEKSIEFILDTPAHLPRVIRGDKRKLRQVLVNLLGNALTYTTSGHVRLGVEPVNPPETQATLPQEAHQWLCFTIADSGTGIAPADMETIFNHFTRGGRHQGAGSGLGLAISRNFVQVMGGSLEVQSHLGKGATFYFTLPIQTPAGPPPQSDASHPLPTGLSPDHPTPKILLVEDHGESRIVFTKLLTGLGFQVETATNGQEGVDQFRAQAPDLILMDIRMPVMDGLAATREIKASPGGQTTPIIALTAHAFENEHEKILEAGCDHVVRKPLNEAALLDALAAHGNVCFTHGAPPAEPVHGEAGAVELAPELKADLIQACTLLDQERVQALIQTISHPETAGQLEALARDFRFDLILDALKETP